MIRFQNPEWLLLLLIVPVLIHRKGSPRVNRPAALVTDVCLTVGKKSWLLPPKTWKGTFTLHEILGDEVLAGFGVGELQKVSLELPELLEELGYATGDGPGTEPRNFDDEARAASPEAEAR